MTASSAHATSESPGSDSDSCSPPCKAPYAAEAHCLLVKPAFILLDELQPQFQESLCVRVRQNLMPHVMVCKSVSIFRDAITLSTSTARSTCILNLWMLCSLAVVAEVNGTSLATESTPPVWPVPWLDAIIQFGSPGNRLLHRPREARRSVFRCFRVLDELRIRDPSGTFSETTRPGVVTQYNLAFIHIASSARHWKTATNASPYFNIAQLSPARLIDELIGPGLCGLVSTCHNPQDTDVGQAKLWRPWISMSLRVGLQ